MIEEQKDLATELRTFARIWLCFDINLGLSSYTHKKITHDAVKTFLNFFNKQLLGETLIIPDITKTESNNCFIIHCFEENNDKRIIAAITVYFQTLKSLKNVQLSDKQIFTVFIKQSSAEKLNAFLKKVSLEMPVQSKPQCFQAFHRVKRSILLSRF